MEVTHIFINACLDKENVVFACDGILFNLKKKREILSFVITWVNLDIILSEISQTQKNRCYMISLYEESRTVKLRSRVERWLLGSRGRRKQGGAGQKVQTFSSAR